MIIFEVKFIKSLLYLFQAAVAANKMGKQDNYCEGL